jgi:hypothetical protein
VFRASSHHGSVQREGRNSINAKDAKNGAKNAKVAHISHIGGIASRTAVLFTTKKENLRKREPPEAFD